MSFVRPVAFILAACAASCAMVGTAMADSTSQKSKICFDGKGAGVITKVMMNISNFNSIPGNQDGNIGIKVKYPDGETRLFNTIGYTRLHTPDGRLLLQQATSAYLSQTKVKVLIDNDDTCESSTWSGSWKGLMIVAPPSS